MVRIGVGEMTLVCKKRVLEAHDFSKSCPKNWFTFICLIPVLVAVQFSTEGRNRGPWENVQRPARGQQGRGGHFNLLCHCLSVCQAANRSHSNGSAEIMDFCWRSGAQTPTNNFHSGLERGIAGAHVPASAYRERLGSLNGGSAGAELELIRCQGSYD